MAEEAPTTVMIGGRTVEVEPTLSIIEAAARSDALTANAGCMGQGVCGACRCLVRRDGEREVGMRLARETRAEHGMMVSFVDYFAADRPHRYDVGQFSDGWLAHRELMEVFPEAISCRHCGGCDRACPRGIEVQRGVAACGSGRPARRRRVVRPVRDVQPVHARLPRVCMLACPELIWPTHPGLAARRVHDSLSLQT
jgi:ferredoxin